MQDEHESDSWLEDWLDSLSTKAYWFFIAALFVAMFFVGVAIKEYGLFPEGGG